MKTSVIVPTFNASRYLLTQLKNLKNQTIKNHELLIIDSSSTDDTVEITGSAGAKTLVIPQEQFDHGGTRTLAGKQAGGDILVYLTQDALPADEHSIENLVRPLMEDEKLGATFGRQLPYPDASSFASHLRGFNYPDKSYRRRLKDRGNHGIKTAFLSNSFAAYRKSALEKIGWFKKKLIMGEDSYAGAKLLLAGHEIAYVASAAVYHSHNYTAFQEFQRYFDIGVFHRAEDWLIREFGKAEGEGMKYIKSELSYLLDRQMYRLLPEFVLRNVLKYLGYKMGQNHERLPMKLVRRLSMHKGWWNRRQG